MATSGLVIRHALYSMYNLMIITHLSSLIIPRRGPWNTTTCHTSSLGRMGYSYRPHFSLSGEHNILYSHFLFQSSASWVGIERRWRGSVCCWWESCSVAAAADTGPHTAPSLPQTAAQGTRKQHSTKDQQWLYKGWTDSQKRLILFDSRLRMKQRYPLKCCYNALSNTVHI